MSLRRTPLHLIIALVCHILRQSNPAMANPCQRIRSLPRNIQPRSRHQSHKPQRRLILLTTKVKLMGCVNERLRVRNRYGASNLILDAYLLTHDRPVTNVEREKLNAMRVDHHVVIAKKTTSLVFTRRFHHTSMY